MNNAFPSERGQAARIVTVGFGAVLLALLIFLFWVQHHAKAEEIRRGRLIFVIEMHTAPDRECIQHALSLNAKGPWQKISDDPTLLRRFNSARHIRADLTYFDNQARLEIYTRYGNPLRKNEATALQHCIPAPNAPPR